MAMQIVFPGPPTRVDDVAAVPVGTVAEDVNGNEYIYLAGVASTVAGNAVVYTGTYTTTRTVAGSRGFVAFAQAAVLASQFGWYLIAGRTTYTATAANAANVRLFVSAVAGVLDDALVTAQLVDGAWAATAESGGTAEVICRYPFASGATVA